MRHAKRTDQNHAAIRDGLRAAGFEVRDYSGAGFGIPDLAVKIGANSCLWLEIKDGNKSKSKQKLTTAEENWFDWNGFNSRKVNSLESALAAIKEFKGDL
jgi:hypothetical protein